MYVKFFRWATDRLGERDGIVCFVSNNSFVDQLAFDGMRKHLMDDFQRVDHIDLHGNVRRNPKLSGTTHNVFGIQVGVGITLAVKKGGAATRLRYHRVPETWRKREKLDFLAAAAKIPRQTLTPDAAHTWLVPEHADEYQAFLGMAEVFDLYSRGVATSRDAVVYDWDRDKLAARMKTVVGNYNAEVHRHQADPDADWPDHIDWSRDLKQDALRGRLAEFRETKIRPALYRPFTKRWLFFDRVLNEEIYQWTNISGRVIGVTDIGSEKPFMALASDTTLTYI